jgi:superfamily II DNA or RNA helicase
MKTLHDWQQAVVDRAVEHDAAAIFWEMSLGKTITSVVLANTWGTKTNVVVLPINTRTSWEREILDQDPSATIYRLGTAKAKDELGFGALNENKPGWYLISWELMRTGALTGAYADLVIADETHRQANMKSLQSQMLKHIKSGKRIALSGTPAGNKPEQLYSTLFWLWPEKYKSYTRWVDDFWLTRRNGAIIDFVREIVPGSVVKDIPMFSRELTRDHRDDMPDVLDPITTMVELTPTQRKIYNKLEADSGVWVGENIMLTGYPFTKDMRLRQIACAVPIVNDDWSVDFDLKAKSSKVDRMLDIMKDVPGETFFIVTHSAKFVPVIVAQLKAKGIRARGFTGASTPDERDDMLTNFGKTFDVLVAGIAAIAEGTDGLQYVCHNMIWASKHPIAYLNTQIEFRLNRPGQTEAIRSWVIEAEDTVDQKANARLEEIEGNLAAVIDYKE